MDCIQIKPIFPKTSIKTSDFCPQTAENKIEEQTGKKLWHLKEPSDQTHNIFQKVNKLLSLQNIKKNTAQ